MEAAWLSPGLRLVPAGWLRCPPQMSPPPGGWVWERGGRTDVAHKLRLPEAPQVPPELGRTNAAGGAADAARSQHGLEGSAVKRQ